MIDLTFSHHYLDIFLHPNVLLYYGKNNLEAVRKDNWKLVFPHESRSYKNVLPKNDGHPGPYSKFTTEYALYNLRRDPGEEYNVKELYPEIVKELENLAEIARNLSQTEISESYLLEVIDKYPETGAAQLAKNYLKMQEERSNEEG